MIILLGSTLVNIILDPCFILGLVFFPEMGVAGSAVATVIARGVAIPSLLWIFVSGRNILKIHSRNFHFNLGMMSRIVKIDVFGSIEMVIMSTTMLILMSFVAAFGTNTIAAYSIGMRINTATIIPIAGLGFAAVTLVGQNLGAKRIDRAESSGWRCALYSILVMDILATFILIFPKQVISFFLIGSEGNLQKIVQTGTNFLRRVMPTVLFVGLGMTLGRAQNGAGDTQLPLLNTGITFLFLRIPLVHFLIGEIGVSGVWAGLAISNMVYGLLMALLFKLGRWKKKVIRR